MKSRKPTKKRSRTRAESCSGDTYLQLDAISGSKNPEVKAFYALAHEEEFAKYDAWLEENSNSEGTQMLVPTSRVQEEFQKAMDRVNARAGYRFIHMLSPVMQQRLREVFPMQQFPGCDCGSQSTALSIGMAG